mmetsp:Transcript_11884/g.42502  ORF Transcript_11884/g.42502 Transcript_11884/m.42502 type:complete len:199 (+) Transcript_11884:50-646(+)
MSGLFMISLCMWLLAASGALIDDHTVDAQEQHVATLGQQDSHKESQQGHDTSEEECSCWKGFKPGIGIPGWGSLTCWSPRTCGAKCSKQFVDGCHMKAACGISPADGKHHCDCSMCSGMTFKQVEYIEQCKPGTCAENESCYYNGCKYSENGGSTCKLGEGVECECEHPFAVDDGKCITCPNGREYDDEKKAWKCKPE